VKRRVLTTTEAAWLTGMDPRHFPAYARARGVENLGRVRIGRSYVTRWAVEDVTRIAPRPDGLTG
jgi:hypothetical protein